MENVILRCLQCNELFCPTRYDSYPSYDFKDNNILKEIKHNDLGDFKNSHNGHKIEKLQVVNGSFFSHYAYWEPVREDYLQITDGSEIYTVRRWRKYINEPLRYQIVNFDIIFSEPILEVQSTDLEKQMIANADRFGFTKTNIRIRKFIKLFKAFVSRLELDNVIECGFSLNDPMISYAKLKDEVRETFLDYCSYKFSATDIKNLRVFISENSEYDDVTNIQVIRPFYLKPLSNLLARRYI
ncbi:MAG: hypothetical protein QG641_1331 [Candidatus Poribacteria bacterium]|nr:hypothetical protein [Candidatus Poribacteria bacterium]